MSAPTYSFYLSGEEAINNTAGLNYYAVAGAVGIDASGNVTGGEQDYNDAFGLTSPPWGDSITGGTLMVDSTTGQGTLTLITNNASLGVAGTETLAVQFVNVNHSLIMQFDGTGTSSGSLDLQDLSSAPSGGFAFTLSGVDSANYAPVAFGGVFSISGTTLSNGLSDINDFGTVSTANPFSGTLSAADAYGRGTITGINFLGAAFLINYYIVGPEAMRIIDVDLSDSAVGSAFGQGTNATAASNASLGASVLTVANSPWSASYGALGQFTTSNTSSDPASFSGVGDVDELDANIIALQSPMSGQYSIASNGYGSLTITGGLSGGDVSSLGIYMTDPNLNLSDPNNPSGGGGALVLDLASFDSGGIGIVVPQTDTSTASFANSYAVGWMNRNYFNFNVCGDCEFDMTAQGTMTGGALNLTGLVVDPFNTLATPDLMSSGNTFAGVPAADSANAGRYSMLSTNVPANSLAVSIDGASFAGAFDLVIYQANGGQLFWLQYDTGDTFVFSGPIEQQGPRSGDPWR